MDFFDPKKRLRHSIIIYIGYVLIGIAIFLTTVVLVYQAYGFGINRRGDVIQNALIFFSSQPSSAEIYINGKLEKSRTNTRLVLQAGNYEVKLRRSGYQDWQRRIELDGGRVAHYDYPLLIPNTLTTTKLLTYQSAPALTTQSPDQRWLLIAQANSLTNFDVFDLKNPTKSPLTISLPADTLSPSTGPQTLRLVEWADDNTHLLVEHLYDNRSEYILIDRDNSLQSINLNTSLAASPSKLTLVDRKYDKYYLLDSATGTLNLASLKSSNQTLVLTNVISFRSYSDDTFLYVTATGADTGRVRVQLKTGDRTFTVRTLPVGSNYLIDLAKYSGKFYVAAGATNDNKVYFYNDPARQLAADVLKVAVPSQVLRVTAPNYLAFSRTAQYIMIENGSQFAVYDLENKHAYNYSALPLDAPAEHATWMDGDRITYVSGGKQLIFDYDYTNSHPLGEANPGSLGFFAADYSASYSLSPAAANGQVSLNQTSLLAPKGR